jgi:hypothetical protein
MVEALEHRCIRYALIGGVAVGFRGRFRLTQDLDFLLDVPQVTLPGLLEDLQGRGFRIDTATVIREWVQDHMTCISFGDVLVDWLKPVVVCFQHVIDDATLEGWDGHQVRIASTESLIVMKLLSFRTQDQADIETLLSIHAGKLNLDSIRQEWASVGEASDPQMMRFEEMVHQFYDPPSN